MSLLVEAVKRAEESRRKAETAPSAQELALLPVEPPAPRSAAPERAPPRENAASLAAKPLPPGNGLLWLAAGAGLLVLFALGVYYWLQLRALDSRLHVAPLAERPTEPLAPVEEAPAPRPPPEAAPSAPPDEKPVSAKPAGNPPPPARPRQAAEAPRPEPEAAPRFTRAFPRAETDETLEAAYAALQAGQNEEARDAYERALRADSRSVDALLGLATLAARRGRNDEAQAWYLRALEADPRDATARAGVLNTSEAESAESLLKTALSEQPGSTPLLFALGSLYAREQRWSEAQQAWFDAFAGEPENPDILFNLAVSLDHLRQDELAARYYQMALDAARARTAAFDPERAGARIRELFP